MLLRPFSEQNYYQVLDLSYDASSEEIQSAYEEAREIYSYGALVSGSILSEQERRHTLERVAEAYQTLIAEESRRIYDERLGLKRAPRRASSAAETTAPSSAPPEEDAPAAGAVGASRKLREGRRCPIELGPAEEATGEFLRRAREAMGLDLGTISEETKIGRSMLDYIESERLDRLPAQVYLRNFTRQFARCLGLDPERIATSYIARVRRLQSE